MAILTRTDLLAAYADNSTQAIKAQQHRDFVDSVMVYGTMHLSAEVPNFNVGIIAVTIPFDANAFPAYGMTLDLANSEFDNFELGHYLLLLDIDFTLVGNNVTYTIQMFDASTTTPIGKAFNYNTRDDSLRLARSFIVPVNVIGDIARVDLRISSTTPHIITLHSGEWTMLRIGSA